MVVERSHHLNDIFAGELGPARGFLVKAAGGMTRAAPFYVRYTTLCLLFLLGGIETYEEVKTANP